MTTEAKIKSLTETLIKKNLKEKFKPHGNKRIRSSMPFKLISLLKSEYKDKSSTIKQSTV